MRLTADHAFHIGTQHSRGGMPCQDYAVSGYPGAGSAFGVISDGCSSGRHTDVGARIVALNTASALMWSASQYFAHHAIDEYCKYNDKIAASSLGLDQRDMLATCGYVAITRRDITIRLIGDGVIAAKRLNGEVVMTRIDWANNMPLYRAYAADEYREFTMAHGGALARAAMVTRLTRHPDGSETEKKMPQPLYEMLPGFGDHVGVRDFEFIAVFSDGVCSVPGVYWHEVVLELMDFKSTEGSFVKRRMNRFISDAEKSGRPPADDISMACIHIGQVAPAKDEDADPPEPCTAEARMEGCTCSMESVNSASIDPPEPIINKWCPLHGGLDPDAEYERRRDDGDV